MSHIVWNESFSIDNAEIDDQHKKWIAIHNELHDALLHSDFRSLQTIAAQTLRKMYDYTRFHFEYEGKYMEQIGYPGIREHWRLHKNFDSMVYGYLRDIEKGQLPILNSELIKILQNWLTDHILTEDKKFCLYQEPPRSF